MKLFEFFDKSQEEILKIVGDKISAKSSAVWIAENVVNVGLLPKSDMIFVFFEGTLLMVSERIVRKGNREQAKQAKEIFKSFEDTSEGDLSVAITGDKEYLELAAFRRGWYAWLDS